ncbi:hypothetical protein [Streptomyces sp. NPDC051214]|uniref:hypothetical protein n=1 Tax=Streptomyces sp. NPDC051214 TaxID=3155282 RepID=UPI00342F4355
MLTDQCATTQQSALDLTGVHYLPKSALETLVDFANNLQAPQRLVIRASPNWRCEKGIAGGGWDQIEGLRAVDAS